MNKSAAVKSGIKSGLAVLVMAAGLAVSSPAFADWDHHDHHDWDHHDHHDHDGVSLSFGFGYNPYFDGYYGYPHYYHHPRPVYYGYPAYYAPPPTVVYEQPAQVIYQPAPTVQANQASETFIDSNGRTCREYQATNVIGGRAQPTYGTACLQPDGSWRIVQ